MSINLNSPRIWIRDSGGDSDVAGRPRLEGTRAVHIERFNSMSEHDYYGP